MTLQLFLNSGDKWLSLLPVLDKWLSLFVMDMRGRKKNLSNVEQTIFKNICLFVCLLKRREGREKERDQLPLITALPCLS